MRNFILVLTYCVLCMPLFAGDLRVVGTGSVSATPDTATISFAVVTDGKDAKEASKSNSTSMKKVMDAVKDLELLDKDVSTSNFNIFPLYEDRATLKGSRSVIVGYRATNQVVVKIRDLKKVGKVIDGFVVAGANHTNSFKFGFSNLSELQDKARILAVKDAKRKALIYSKALGVEVNAVPKNFSENINYDYEGMHSSRNLQSADTITPIKAGEEIVSVTVNVVWEMERKTKN